MFNGQQHFSAVGIVSDAICAAMASERGCLRSDALLTSRAALVVGFPGNQQSDRIITVRAIEHSLGMALRRLRRQYPSDKTAELQVAWQLARASLRNGCSEDTGIKQALRMWELSASSKTALAVERPCQKGGHVLE